MHIPGYKLFITFYFSAIKLNKMDLKLNSVKKMASKLNGVNLTALIYLVLRIKMNVLLTGFKLLYKPFVVTPFLFMICQYIELYIRIVRFSTYKLVANKNKDRDKVGIYKGFENYFAITRFLLQKGI